MTRVARALTIAGSDSGGGAGIQADLKAFLASGVYGMSVITALTAQNTIGVHAVHPVPPDFVRAQLDVVLEDIGADAVKTGMLVDATIIAAVADGLQEHQVTNLVVDPVMIAKSGHALLAPEARHALVTRLLPLATIATPNLHETEAILGRPVRTLADMEAAAVDLHALGVAFPLVKGGHAAGEEAVDVFYDGKNFHHLAKPHIETVNTHGTGCTLSAAICAALAKGGEPLEAVRYGKEFIHQAIETAVPLGRGHGPTNPGAMLEGLS